MHYKIILILAFTLLNVSCSENFEKGKRVMESGRNLITSEVTFVQDLTSVLSHSEITISAFIDDNPLHRKVQLMGFINEKFRVLVNFDVEFSETEPLSLIRYSEPEIYVHVIRSITQLQDGRYKLNGGGSYEISTEEVDAFLRKEVTASELMRHLLDDKQGIEGFKGYIEAIKGKD